MCFFVEKFHLSQNISIDVPSQNSRSMSNQERIEVNLIDWGGGGVKIRNFSVDIFLSTIFLTQSAKFSKFYEKVYHFCI